MSDALFDDADEAAAPTDEPENYLALPSPCAANDVAVIEEAFRKSRRKLPILFSAETEDGREVWDDDRQAAIWQRLMITPAMPRWPRKPLASEAESWLLWRLAMNERERWERVHREPTAQQSKPTGRSPGSAKSANG